MFSKTNFKIHGWKRLEEKQIVCVTLLELLRVAFLNHGTSLSVLLHGLRPSHSFTAVKIRSLRMTAHLKCDCCKLLITFIHKHDSVFLSYLCYSSEHVAYSLFYWQSKNFCNCKNFWIIFRFALLSFSQKKKHRTKKKANLNRTQHRISNCTYLFNIVSNMRKRLLYVIICDELTLLQQAS